MTDILNFIAACVGIAFITTMVIQLQSEVRKSRPRRKRKEEDK